MTAAPAVGTRLRCESCGTEIIVVRVPKADVVCCDKPMGPLGGGGGSG